MKIIESHIVSVDSVFRDSSRGRIDIKVFRKVYQVENGKFFIEDLIDSELQIIEITENKYRKLINN